MDAKELQQKLRTTYNRETWKEILLEIFPDAELFAHDRLTVFTRKEQRSLANHIAHFGEVELNGDKLIFLEVELKPDSVQLTKNRVGLRKLVDNEVIAGLTDGALISYYQPETDEWRITFYSERYGWDEDGNTIKEETHPKRYTYVVGPSEFCKTAAGQLVKVIEKGRSNTLESVLRAFSVQKVSKEFFKEYKLQYDKFVGHLTGKVWTRNGVQEVGERISQFQFYFKATTDHEKEARNFVKKLLGRIVFLYFVQKKQWLGASSAEFKDGNLNFIYDLFKQVPEDNKDQFYSQWLTKLFFDTLNRDDDHAFEMPNGHSVFIPFLNGGLFEKDETDQNTESLSLPGELFSNPEDSESPNTRGFLDFLSSYNFTIHEDSPGDHTIAVDPEMLGEIFENLLEDNKEKGAYYTPKPIVHYMCQESLIEYLFTELTTEDIEDAEKDELRGYLEDLIKKQEAGELVGFTEPILKALKKVKVCDPAIGSGAFPMGILQEIYQAVETLHHLSPDNVRAIWELPDEDWHPAEVKKQIIQNSIYGVDIEKGAVDIARLRFWLSLIVDEEEPTALPNLDYKIVVGDSLVSKLVLNGQEKVVEINWKIKESVGKAKEHVDYLRQTLDAIVNKQKDFFEADNKAKKELREEIKKLKIDALIYQLKYDREYYSQKTEVKGGMMPTSADKEHNLTREMQLKEYTNLIEELQKVKRYPESEFQHFEWKLDFPEILNPAVSPKPGFDIVIGNPPYVQLQKDSGRLAETLQDRNFQTFARTGDIYSLFYEKGWQILREKGLLCFITSNKWMRAGYGEKTRKFFAEKTNPIILIDFAGQKIFATATVDTNILLFSKDKNRQQTKACVIKEKVLNNLSVYFRQTHSISSFTNSDSWVILSEIEKRIKEKIERIGTPLKDWDIRINYGIKTGYNKAFIIDGEKRKELIEEDPKSDEIIRPILRGRDIKRYGYDFADKWLIATFPSLKIDIEKYPAVKQYLLSFGKERLEQSGNKGSRKKTNNKWFETQDSINYWEDFLRPKIIYPNMTKFLPFVYDEKGFLTNQKCFILTGQNVAFLTAFFNSSLFKYCFRDNFPELQGGTRELSKIFFDKVPVLEVSDKMNKEFEKLVLKLQDLITKQKPTKDLEVEIDEKIFDLYPLTKDERKTIGFIEIL